MTAEQTKVALIGLGTIGTGVARLLLDFPERIARRAGRPIVLKRIVDRDLTRPRDIELPRDLLTDDLAAITGDPEIEVVVQLIGGLEPARTIMLDLLESGKDVVTANKALLAEHGPELFDRARDRGRSIAFEASVAGGIPIVAGIGQCLAANQIESVCGILNGTSNFILSEMEAQGTDYATAVAEAQRRGYAEADPTMDVDGTDATQKLAILAQLAFGARVRWLDIPRTGIESLEPTDVAFARELGYRIKLLAAARLDPAGLTLYVAPTLVHIGTPLAEVRGAYNAVRVMGDAVGRVFFQGLGAGQLPTASAVIADVIDTAVGRTAITFRTLELWSQRKARVAARDAAETPGRFYLRLAVGDHPGVMAELAGVLGAHKISIASILQHEGDGQSDEVVSLVIMTHETTEGAIQRACGEIDRLACVRARQGFDSACGDSGPMKYAVVIPDGAADEPQEMLGGKTPLEAAKTPAMDAIAAKGVVGLANHVPADLPAGSAVANLSLLGYDPAAHFTGRAPLEAAAQGIEMAADDWAVRCNLVTIAEQIMVDFTAGHVSTEEATELLKTAQQHCDDARLEFFPGVSYRNLLVCRVAAGPAPFSADTRTTPPHDLTGRSVLDDYPRGPGSDLLNELMTASVGHFADHPVNTARRAAGKPPVTNTWLWGQGRTPQLEPFAHRYGCRGAMITAVDLLRGLAALIGWSRIDVPGATGYTDTDYRAKGEAAIAALREPETDLVCVHVEAPDEASHEGDCAAKVRALEAIDEQIVAPLAEWIEAIGDGRILVSPDHPTPLRTRTHSHGGVPLAIAGRGVSPDAQRAYHERAAAESGLALDAGWHVMELFLGRNGSDAPGVIEPE